MLTPKLPCYPSVLTILLLTFALPLAGDELASVLAEIDADPALGRAIWAFDVTDSEGREIASRNSDQLMATGSVRKLFTAAIVAECEGLSQPIATDVFLRGSAGAGGVWNGALVLEASGDPTIGGRWEYETDRLVRLRPIATELKRRGVRSLRDGVVIDVSAFESELIGSAWKWDNLTSSYAAPIDAASFNENAVVALVVPRGCGKPVVDVEPPWVAARVETDCSDTALAVELSGLREITVRGSMRDVERDTIFLAQRRPAEALGDAMRVALAEEGIIADSVAVERHSSLEEPRHATVPIARVESPPIGALLGTVLADSSNLYSEMLFKRVSRWRGVASWHGSLEVERGYLTHQVGLEPGSFRFDDGSGLSPENLVTARSTVELLRHVRSAPGGRERWEGWLARPGDDGTLRKRLLPLRGRLFAKTGTIDGVAGLAGWLYRDGGSPVYFAIFVNNHATAGRDVSQAIDRIVLAIAQ
ncbi:MAG: D-alanyl-D-alanine carboxypeptidase/D-alanyl-D-alanine-endopeptidase [Acidobacteria bacterium]|nr:D-alanyl-D-alanine carboxypeptidase/D-alanyl-D-alanine-endopeptidase [Acidobacteriota bacterium]